MVVGAWLKVRAEPGCRARWESWVGETGMGMIFEPGEEAMGEVWVGLMAEPGGRGGW